MNGRPSTWGHAEVPAQAPTEGPCLGPWLFSSKDQWQWSWVILSLENMGTSLVWATTRDHVHVQGLC